jgi:hypothetical protein
MSTQCSLWFLGCVLRLFARRLVVENFCAHWSLTLARVTREAGDLIGRLP